MGAPCTKFMIFNAEFIVSNTEFMIFNTQTCALAAAAAFRSLFIGRATSTRVDAHPRERGCV